MSPASNGDLIDSQHKIYVKTAKSREVGAREGAREGGREWGREWVGGGVKGSEGREGFD